MRLIRFGDPGQEKPGLLQRDGVVDLRRHFPQIPDIDDSFFKNGWLERLADFRAAGEAWPTRLGPPLRHPSKIICLGKNYRDHALESGTDVPIAPLLFCKSPNSLNGPFDPVVLPRCSGQIDWEVELAVIIGKRTKAVSQATALSQIAGVTICNDVSGREAQFGDGQWFRGKSFDTFAPLGPAMVTLDEVGDLQNLELTSTVNGQTMQADSTRNMIFHVAEVIAYISQDITLMPGDILCTGTPAGVGIFQNPVRVLQVGDEVVCRIEKIGAIRNRVVSADDAEQTPRQRPSPSTVDLF